MLRPTNPIIGSCLTLVVLGCPSTKSTPPNDDSSHPQTTATPSEGDEGGPEPDGNGKVGGPILPSGPLCDSNADCSEGQVCEGVGCEPGQGRCGDGDRMCTRDLATYCGCDGTEFQSSGSCPEARYAYRGACAPELEDGEPCTDGRQCRSKQCVGDGLEGCSAGDQGVCGAASCTKDLAQYCSCNNTEFHASGTCPDRQFAYRGPCEGG